MVRIALMVVLLVGAFARDNTAFLLARWVEMPAPGIYRVLGGLWEAALALIIALLLLTHRKDIFRTLSIAGCLVAAFNGLMNAACRIGLPPPPYPANATQCDTWAGWLVDAFVLTLQIMCVCVIFGIWLVDRRVA